MIEQEVKVEERERKIAAHVGFRNTEQNGGVIDYRINVKGRPTYKGLTNKEIREKEFLLLVRKFKPHIAKAVGTIVGIMHDENASQQNKLKAAGMFLMYYKEIMKEAYSPEYDKEEREAINEESVPTFSLRMINADESPSDVDDAKEVG